MYRDGSNWKETYRDKLRTLPEILRLIPSGCNMVTSHCAAEPQTILYAMAASKELYRDVNIFSNLIIPAAPYCAAGMAGHLHYSTFFAGGGSRAAVQAGTADYIPAHYSAVPSLLGDAIPVDVALLHLSPPDEAGYCSFGLTVDYQRAAAQAAKLVIAQVNQQMPRTLGDSLIHMDQVDYVLPVDVPVLTAPPKAPGPVETAIGANCASLIRDGDTLQLGIGAIPDASLLALKGRRHLGIHSEMLSDCAMGLMEAGIIDNSQKTFDKGKSVATFLLGSEALYRFAHNNPAVSLHPVSYTNDVRVVARQENFVSVNSALAIDLCGQVCAETIGGQQFSGVGGQMDFFRGAALSPGGRGILALPSTARRGTVSRIVPRLSGGDMVTTSRNDVDYVVTEYGIARLKGKSLTQRAEALIAIAHPDFRPELTKRA